MKTVFSSASRRIAAFLLLFVLLLPLASPFAKTGSVESEEGAVPALQSGSPDDGLITESEAYQYVLGELLKCKTGATSAKDEEGVTHFYICVSVDVEKYHLNQTELDQIFQTLYYSEAELFFLIGRYSFTHDGSRVAKTLSPACVEVPTAPSDEEVRAYGETLSAQLTEFHALADAIVAQVNPTLSEWEKVAFIHDYVALHYDYDHIHEKDDMIYDAYGMLKSGIGVCQAYSLLTRYLLKKLGIECECVSSSELNHEWNIVKIGGHWYHMDVTWDDRDDKGFYGQVSHEFFLSSDAHFYNGSSEERSHHGAWTSPVGTDNFKYDGKFADVTTPFIFASDAIYAISDGVLVTYDPATGNFTELFSLGLQWHAFGGVWQGTYAGLWYLDGKLYWNGEDAVFSYAPGSGATSGTRVDRYLDFRKSIYGMRAEADERTVVFTFSLMTDPNSGEVEEKVRSKGGYVITWLVAGDAYETLCIRGDSPYFDPPGIPSNLFDYSFVKWDKTVVAAASDATYTAQFRMDRNDVELNGKTLREQYRLIRAAILLLPYANAGYADAADRAAELDDLAAAYADSAATYNATFTQVLFGGE